MNDGQSLVLVDNKSQDVYDSARMVDFQDSPMSTFCVGDAKYAWDWTIKRMGVYDSFSVEQIRAGQVNALIPAGWEPELHTGNDFAYTKYPYAYMNTPLF